MKKIDIQMQIDSLSIKYKDEMIKQNNKNSLVRCYAKADSI